MKKILVVNNNIDPPYEGGTEIVDRIREHLADFGEAEIVMVRAPAMQLPASAEGFDAVFLSGSKTRVHEAGEWIDKQKAFIKDVHQRKIPTLGICYGEQLIAQALAGDESASAAPQPEFGWVEMQLLPEAEKSPVFHTLPQKFYSFQYHSDEVRKLPADRFRVLAKSADCAIQAYEVKDAPIWAVQFHPERPLDAGNKSLDRLRQRDPGKKIFHRDAAERVFDGKVAREIFRNFLSVVWKGSRK